MHPCFSFGVISHFPYEETELHEVIGLTRILESWEPFLFSFWWEFVIGPGAKQGFWFAEILSGSGWCRTHLDHPAGWNRRAIDLSIWD